MIINIGSETFEIYPLQPINLYRAAIYTIWTFNPTTNVYPLLYVGETGNLGQRIDTNHHKYKNWLNNAVSGLFMAVKLMPTNLYTEQQRRNEETRLINLYNPSCNG